MPARVTRLADHQAKHRRVPSSLPPLNFPGNDPISIPLLDAGWTPELLEECGFRVLPAAMRLVRRSRPHLRAVPA